MSATGGDVFIPEALEGSKEEKRAYDSWVENKLIPALDEQGISYILASRDFPVVGNLSLTIEEAVKNCTYTVCCLCPVITTIFYKTLFAHTRYQNKVIFLNVGLNLEGCSRWAEFNKRITIDVSDDNMVQRGVRRIRETLDQNRSQRDSRSCAQTLPTSTNTNLDVGVKKKRPGKNRPRHQPPDTDTDLDARPPTAPCMLTPGSDQPRNPSYPESSSETGYDIKFENVDNPYERLSHATVGTCKPRILGLTDESITESGSSDYPVDNASSSPTYSDDGKSACEMHSINDPLNICKHIIPNALRERDYDCLADLYALSCHDAVKRQALQTMKELLTRYTFTTDKELGEQLVHIENVLRPKQDGPKDPTIVKLYLEVYHLVVTLLYVAVASGSVSQQQVGDVLEHGQEASSSLEALVSEQLQVHWADADQLNSHMYIIGKFLKEKLRAAVETPKYIDKLNVFLKRLNSLTDPRLTVDERSSRQRVIEPSITKCLPDKFHQHVVFHYLVILVGRHPRLQSMLTTVTKMIVDRSNNVVWSCLSLLRGYCNLCEICDDQEVIKAITTTDSYFRQTVLKFRKKADKLNVVTEILSAILFHPSTDIREVAHCSLRRDKKGALTSTAVASINDACRMKIEKMFSSDGLTLEPDQTTIEGLCSNECVLHKGSFSSGQSVYCKFQSPHSLREWASGATHNSSVAALLKHEVKLLEHLQQNGFSNNIIALHVGGNKDDIQLPYYVFSCDNMDMNLSTYLVRSVNQEKKVQLRERVGLAMDVLSAVNFCNKRNVLIRHICAYAFLLTRQQDKVVAKLADFSQARIVNSGANQSCAYYGHKDEEVAVAWAAPESLLKREYTVKTEVFSASQAMHEILSHGIHPYQELGNMSLDRTSQDNSGEYHKSLVKKYQQILKYRIWPERKPGEPEGMFVTLLASFLLDPEKRPSIEQLQVDFQNFQKHTPLESGTVDLLALQMVLRNQPSAPELCSHSDITEIMEYTDLWEDHDASEHAYTALCVGFSKHMFVACTEDELNAHDDPEPIEMSNSMFKSLVMKDNLSEEEKVQLLQLKHDNVATVKRFVTQTRQLYMVTDCSTQTTLLEQMLYQKTIPMEVRLSYYMQIASGMTYLHERKLIHGCLQAKFIYITSDNRAVIGQLTRASLVHPDVYDDDMSHVMELPFRRPPISSKRWMSKETNDSRFMTQKTDVHSFGVVIWEAENILCQPDDTPRTHLVPYCYVKHDQIAEMQRLRHMLPQSPWCPDWLDALVKSLMANPACRRPSFPEAHYCLEKKQPYNPDVESSKGSQPANRKKLRTVSKLIESEDEEMGFSSRGTLYDQERRQTTLNAYSKEQRRTRIGTHNQEEMSTTSVACSQGQGAEGKRMQRQAKRSILRSHKSSHKHSERQVGFSMLNAAEMHPKVCEWAMSSTHHPSPTASQHNIHGDTQHNVCGDTQHNIRRDTQHNVCGDTQHNIHGDTQHNIHGDTQHDIHADTQHNKHGDTQHNIHADTQHNKHGDTQHNIHCDTLHDRDTMMKTESYSDYRSVSIPGDFQRPERDGCIQHVSVAAATSAPQMPSQNVSMEPDGSQKMFVQMQQRDNYVTYENISQIVQEEVYDDTRVSAASDTGEIML